MTLKRWWRCASLGLVCLLASGCWASFPENLLSEEAGANDGGVDRPADTPGVETAVPEGGPDTTRDGGLGDGTVDSTSDLPQPDGPVSDSTVDGQPPDSTVDTTPSDSTVDSDPCAGQSCPLGCNASAARCNRLDPSNFNVASVYGQLTFDADATNNTAFNTDTGEVRAGLNLIRSSGGPGTVKNGIYWAVVTQGGGAPQIGVFAMRSLRVRSGTTLDFEGGNAAAIYTAGPINIEGTVRARRRAHRWAGRLRRRPR